MAESGGESEEIQMIRKPIGMILICAFSLAVYCFTISVSGSNATKPDLLKRKIQATTIKGKTFDQVLSILTSDYNIPVGIELGDSKLSRSREFDLDLPETNLKEFLDAVFAKDPQYTWRLEGGVIHVWPVTGRDTLLVSLLDTKVSHFAAAETASRYQINSDIMEIPEIKIKLIVADVAPMIFISFNSMDKLEKGVVLEESDLTLRQLLDKVVQKMESKRWVIYRWGENNEYITLRS